MAQPADKSEPLLFPAVYESFVASIGRLMVQWALMEQQLNISLSTGITQIGMGRRHGSVRGKMPAISIWDIAKNTATPR